jgi:hypothetical protein
VYSLLVAKAALRLDGATKPRKYAPLQKLDQRRFHELILVRNTEDVNPLVPEKVLELLIQAV